jgi:hypothetical protein
MNGGSIAQKPGVHVTYYIDGNITLDGGTFDNQDKIPANCQIYGTTPLLGQKTFDVQTNTTIIANIDAPDFNFNFESGGTSLTGSLVGYSLDVHSAMPFHYDEAGGTKGSYAVASWYEDSR